MGGGVSPNDQDKSIHASVVTLWYVEKIFQKKVLRNAPKHSPKPRHSTLKTTKKKKASCGSGQTEE